MRMTAETVAPGRSTGDQETTTHATPATTSPAHLLFLIADTGGGHRAAAEAVARRLAAAHPGRFATHVLEPFAAASPPLVESIMSLYAPLIRRTPRLWGAIYRATDSPAMVRALRSTLFRMVDPGVEQVVDVLQPAAIVCFHHIVAHVATRAVRRLGLRIPVITVVTDLVDVHALWVCRDVDAVVTASPGARDRVRRAGVPAERCFDLGLPIDDSFAAAPPSGLARDQLRSRLGLGPERFTVLLMGGGEGAGRLDEQARALLDARLGLQVVAICGRNAAVQTRLDALDVPPGERLVVRGFVDGMAGWMWASDLLITKAGPGTIAEAMAAQLPMLITSYVPGQEESNSAYVVDTGGGRYVPHLAEMVDAVRELSRPGAASLVAMREALRHAARPQATAQVAELIVRLAVPDTAA